MSFVYLQVYESQVVSFVVFRFMSLRFETLESAVRISRGHLQDVLEDPNLAAFYVLRRGQLSSTCETVRKLGVRLQRIK